jgi:hypothetical protein
MHDRRSGGGRQYGSGTIGAGRGKHDYVDDAAGARGVHVRAMINDIRRSQPGSYDRGACLWIITVVPTLSLLLTMAIVFIPVSAPIVAHLGSGVCQSKMFPP